MKSKIEMILEFLPQEQRDEIERGIRAMVEASTQLRMRDKVRLYRLEHGLTQVDFARLANLDRGILQRFEHEKSSADVLLSNILKIAHLMGCTIDELLDEQTKADLLAKQPGKKPSRKGEKNGSEK